MATPGDTYLLAVFNMLQSVSFMRRNCAAIARNHASGPGTTTTRSQPRSRSSANPESVYSPETTVMLEAGLSLQYLLHNAHF